MDLAPARPTVVEFMSSTCGAIGRRPSIRTGNLTLGFNLDYGSDGYSWYGAALYAQYKLTKVITLAARGEYLHEDAGADKFGAGGVFGVAADGTTTFNPQSSDDWSETLTVSFAVWDNLLTRVEYRFDDIDGAASGTGHTSLQNEISAEAVYSFYLEVVSQKTRESESLPGFFGLEGMIVVRELRMNSNFKMFGSIAMAGLFALPVLADEIVADGASDAKDQKDLKKVIETQSINYVETAQKGIVLSGYVDTSYTEQFSGRNTPGNGSSPFGNRQASSISSIPRTTISISTR